MTLTDAKVIRWLRAINCLELEEHMDYISDDEIEGRSDIQVFTDELSYCISNYEEDGHSWHDDLKSSKELLRGTKNGTVIPYDSKTLQPKSGYRPSDILIAKNIVNEYNRMLYRYKQLNKLGYYGKWL